MGVEMEAAYASREEEERRNLAAAKIQSVQRGKVGRQRALQSKEGKRMQEEALQRQRQVDLQATRVRDRAIIERRMREDTARREAAAQKIQSLQRGKLARQQVS